MNEKAIQKYTKPLKGPEKIAGMTGLEPVYICKNNPRLIYLNKFE